MIERIVDKLVENQLKEKKISEEDANIYRYGYVLAFEVIINIIIAMIIGVVFGEIFLIGLFLVIYIPLRSFCGGWHAPKLWICTILSNLILLVLVGLDKYVFQDYIIWPMLLCFVIAVIIVLGLAPVGTKTKLVMEDEKIAFKKTIKKIIMVHSIFILSMAIMGWDKYVFVMMFAYIVQVFMLILEIPKNREVK